MYSYIFRAARGLLGAGAVSWPQRAAGAAGEDCCFDLGTGWTCPSRGLFTYPAHFPGRGCLSWLLGQQPRRRPWANSKRRHLDSPNLWCGRYRCSPGLTSLFGGADHSRGSTTETSPPLPSGGLPFPSLHLLLTPERQISDWPRPSLNCRLLQEAFPACWRPSPTAMARVAAERTHRLPQCSEPRATAAPRGIARASSLAGPQSSESEMRDCSGSLGWFGSRGRGQSRHPGFRPPALRPLRWLLGRPLHPDEETKAQKVKHLVQELVLGL
ncbi:uncharacterized protein LOC123936926 [Meles meles]|uniref:uncharacterized protein LOC123936926 n=1 Tax=Meles meles TaxID=9662 RepID=UPI001E69C3E6|nr:uncharacterized protein LOC123936926 [Meles meles]